jgi:protein gp37
MRFDPGLGPSSLTEPFGWKVRLRICVNPLSDLFQDGITDSSIDRVFAVMALAPRHTFAVLTKYAARMRAYLSDAALFTRIVEACNRAPDGSEAMSDVTPNLTTLSRAVRRERHLMHWPLSNVWLGVSVENQHVADERVPLLLRTPAAVRFLSCEPLLEAVDLSQYLGLDRTISRDFRMRQEGGHDRWSDEFTGRNTPGEQRHAPDAGLHWVIVGGESGPGARPLHLAWARSLVAQSRGAGVAVFVTQLGGRAETNVVRALNRHGAGGDRWLVVGDKRGGDMSEWPEDLRVREFPAGPP